MTVTDYNISAAEKKRNKSKPALSILGRRAIYERHLRKTFRFRPLESQQNSSDFHSTVNTHNKQRTITPPLKHTASLSLLLLRFRSEIFAAASTILQMFLSIRCKLNAENVFCFHSTTLKQKYVVVVVPVPIPTDTLANTK